MPADWAAMAAAAGGVAELAGELAVTSMSLWRWSNGGTMAGTSRRVVEAFCQRHRLPTPSNMTLLEKREKARRARKRRKKAQ